MSDNESSNGATCGKSAQQIYRQSAHTVALKGYNAEQLMHAGGSYKAKADKNPQVYGQPPCGSIASGSSVGGSFTGMMDKMAESDICALAPSDRNSNAPFSVRAIARDARNKGKSDEMRVVEEKIGEAVAAGEPVKVADVMQKINETAKSESDAIIANEETLKRDVSGDAESPMERSGSKEALAPTTAVSQTLGESKAPADDGVQGEEPAAMVKPALAPEPVFASLKKDAVAKASAAAAAVEADADVDGAVAEPKDDVAGNLKRAGASTAAAAASVAAVGKAVADSAAAEAAVPESAPMVVLGYEIPMWALAAIAALAVGLLLMVAYWVWKTMIATKEQKASAESKGVVGAGVTAVGSTIGAAGDLVGGAVGAVTDVAGSAVSTVGNVVGGAVKQVGQGIESIAGTADRAITQVGEGGEKLIGSVARGDIAQAGQAVVDAGSAVASGAAGIVGDVVDTAGDVADVVVSKVAPEQSVAASADASPLMPSVASRPGSVAGSVPGSVAGSLAASRAGSVAGSMPASAANSVNEEADASGFEDIDSAFASKPSESIELSADESFGADATDDLSQRIASLADQAQSQLDSDASLSPSEIEAAGQDAMSALGDKSA